MKRQASTQDPVSAIPKRPKMLDGVSVFPPDASLAPMAANRTSGRGTADTGPWQRTLIKFSDPITNTPGYNSDSTMSFSKCARANSEDLGSLSEEMNLIILKKKSAEPQIHWIDPDQTNRRYTLVNIPHFNYFISQIQKFPKTPDEVKDAMDIWRNFAIEGVVLNETNASADWRLKGRAGIPTTQEKTLTFAFKGRVQCKNIWGNHIKQSTKLFLILKKKEIKGHFVVDADGLNHKQLNVGGVEDGQPLTNRPFQLEPYAKFGVDYPPPEELLYLDEFGRRHYGLAIYIGTIWYDLQENYSGKNRSDLTTNYKTHVTLSEANIWLEPNF